ncbi:MAG TPA: EF-hand domain-containing protein [Kofleriaceae bacterium]|nr:EF-hand domain-containing protein [Kofleriaceae bacterium]
MKLAALAFLTTLGLGGVAGADPAGPGNPAPLDPRVVVPAGPPAPVARRADRPRGQLRQALMERFDRNHDGRLDPEERRHAIHALRRMARRMEVQDRRDERGAARREERMRELVRRYDRNGDGVVGPDEMPPGLARRLQRLDRNGDGWLDERDR